MQYVALHRPSTDATKGHPDRIRVVYNFYIKSANLFKCLPSYNRDVLNENARQLFSKASVLFKSRVHTHINVMRF